MSKIEGFFFSSLFFFSESRAFSHSVLLFFRFIYLVFFSLLLSKFEIRSALPPFVP